CPLNTPSDTLHRVSPSATNAANPESDACTHFHRSRTQPPKQQPPGAVSSPLCRSALRATSPANVESQQTSPRTSRASRVDSSSANSSVVHALQNSTAGPAIRETSPTMYDCNQNQDLRNERNQSADRQPD